MAFKNPTTVSSDGWFAAALALDDGSTVRQEFKHTTMEEALAEAEAWFEKETGGASPK